MKKILLAADSKNTRDLIKKSLEKNGHEIILAENGEEVIAISKIQLPDLIIMDMALPEVSGLAATKRLRSDRRTVKLPIFIMSVSEESQTMFSETHGTKIDDFLLKPFALKTLQDKIQNFFKLGNSNK